MKYVFLALASFLLLSACSQQNNIPAGNNTMTLEEATAIAENSDCINLGPLTQDSFYNENTKTWWIDIDVEEKGCSPACVVSEETKSAEVNHRCTGLVMP